jgi:tRNA1Val (adenine37-N6)-methyltransferase
MANNYFSFKEFTIYHDKCAFKVGTDGVLLGACADLSGTNQILDIGTGTGLIAIMAAQRSKAVITAIEPDKSSYLQACENAAACKWNDRIVIKNETLQTFQASISNKFDCIVSNPPYFRNSLVSPDPKRTASRHNYSLTSDELLKGVRELLEVNGSFQVILPYAEGTMFIAEASAYGLFCSRIIKIKPVPSGLIIRMIMKFERKKIPVNESFLTIETGTRHAYTEEYKKITGDFYLKF